MDPDALLEVIEKWKNDYLQLLDDASELLRNFDGYRYSGPAELIARRQQIIDRFQNYDVLLRGHEILEKKHEGLFEGFASFREDVTKKILEIDALVIALAMDRQIVLQGEFAGLTKRKTVISAYEANRSSTRQVRMRG